MTTLGRAPDHVGPSAVTMEGTNFQLDVVVAADAEAPEPSARAIRAIGEAKSGETVGESRLRHRKHVRATLGTNAAGARRLLFAPACSPSLKDVAEGRRDVELIGLERLYAGKLCGVARVASGQSGCRLVCSRSSESRGVAVAPIS
jgi:hypothetical protein